MKLSIQGQVMLRAQLENELREANKLLAARAAKRHFQEASPAWERRVAAELDQRLARIAVLRTLGGIT